MSSGRSAGAIAKDRGWPSSSIRQRVAALSRGNPAPLYVRGKQQLLTLELLDEIRKFIEEEQGRISMRTVAIRFTRRAPRSWSQLACALAWTVLATCSLHTSSHLRRRSTLRSYHDPLAKTLSGADAVFQDGAPSLTARTTRSLLGEMLRETQAWPALSPDFAPNDCAFWSVWESLVAQKNPTDATTLRAAIIKTNAKITGDQIRRMIWPFASALLPTAATFLLHCVDFFVLDELSKADPTIADLDGTSEGVNIA